MHSILLITYVLVHSMFTKKKNLANKSHVKSHKTSVSHYEQFNNLPKSKFASTLHISSLSMTILHSMEAGKS